MSRPRKTYPVDALKGRVNRALDALTTSPEERSALATLLEGVLHETGNYRGFSYLGSEYLPAEEQTADEVLRPGYDDTRRRYL